MQEIQNNLTQAEGCGDTGDISDIRHVEDERTQQTPHTGPELRNNERKIPLTRHLIQTKTGGSKKEHFMKAFQNPTCILTTAVR